MTKVEFFFDPSCPFCWITSRWLIDVAKQRDIDITWRQFSLALKNNELDQKPDEDKHAEVHRQSHRIQRVICAAAAENGASVIELYSEFGMRFHIQEKPFDDAMIAEVLAAKDLPTDLINAADDTSYDDRLEREIDSAVEAAGGDIGVPTIVFMDKEGKRIGYFGPVLGELPTDINESLALWDGLSALGTTSSFYELKRSRSGDPNVFSAAHC